MVNVSLGAMCGNTGLPADMCSNPLSLGAVGIANNGMGFFYINGTCQSTSGFLNSLCTFITAEINNFSVTLECNFKFSINQSESIFQAPIYIMERSNFSDGFVIILSRSLDITIYDTTLFIPRFSGTIRIAYFNSETMIDILINNCTVYPIESTIGTTATDTNNDVWNVDTLFEWTTRSINNIDGSLLMLALPHHNIINVVYESDLMFNPLIGPYRFLTTNSNSWVLADAVANYNFEYPSIGDTESLSMVWETEISNIINSQPRETVIWCKWLGSIATLLLIGDMLDSDISVELNILKNNLSLIQTRNGALSQYNTFIHDQTWGGIISNLGLDNCSGDCDNGNAFYESHIGQFGYLVFAYAVAGYFDKNFINTNKETALLFARDIVNPHEHDNTFPLWRNKDWYFGYSISSGLSPQQERGKDTSDIGELIFVYYASYLLSLVIDGQQELMNWSLAMLASEVTALQYYFQFASDANKIDVNSAFVQGTIPERGDTYYNYTVNTGNDTFPARNASIMVPIIKPFSLLSFDYINDQWAKFAQFWMNPAVAAPGIEPESFGYAESLLAVEATPETKQTIVNNIVASRDIYLPYGSTWSAMLYWILSQ